MNTYLNKEIEYQSVKDKSSSCDKPRNSFDYIQKIYAKEIMSKIIDSFTDSSKNWILNNIKQGSSGCIAFVMSKNGTIKKSDILKSSESHFIDVAALKAVNALGRLYVPIEKLLDDKNEVNLEFGYKIEAINSNRLKEDTSDNDSSHEDPTKKYRIMQ
jgi:hypothetical protein